MPNDDLKIKNDDKMRLHYRKRSGKNTNSQLSNSEYVIEQIDSDSATKEEKAIAKNTLKYEDADGDVQYGKENKKGNVIFLDTAAEKKRRYSHKFEKSAVYTAIIAVILLMLFIVINWYAKSPSGQKILTELNRDKYISEDGNYIFGSFDGYVTIGSTIDEAVDILGLPTPGSENQYFYGNSYLLVENDIVVGYHKDPEDYFLVTVGFRINGRDPTLNVGDRAKRVVENLGSPTTYLKNVWIYEGMNKNFTYSYYSNSGSKLIITFDDDYLVKGYEFVDQ